MDPLAREVLAVVPKDKAGGPLSRDYFLTAIALLTVLLPALFDTTLKVAMTLPVRTGRSLRGMARVAPAPIGPTGALSLMPLPLTMSLLPFAVTLPELVTLALKA
jgi:hypothetical protein